MKNRVLLQGGLVADGSGRPAREGNVLLEGDRILEVGQVSQGQADVVIDCAGRVVSPGFIDIHTHSDLSRFAYPLAESRVLQGITTEAIGNCGLSPAPIKGETSTLRGVVGPIDVVPGVEITWRTVSEYFYALEAHQGATNVAPLVGHGALVVAANAIAGSNSVGTDHYLSAIKKELVDALDAGAWGLSLGLMYSPGESSPTEELVALAQIVATRGGLLSAHMRAYDGPQLPAAVREVLALSEETGVKLQISHLRSIQDDGSGLKAALELLECSSCDVQADAYPYLAGHTTLLQLLPSDLRSLPLEEILNAVRANPSHVSTRIMDSAVFAAQAITIAKAPETPWAVGRTLDEISFALQAGNWGEAAVSLLLENGLSVDVIVIGTRPEDALEVMAHPLVSIGSDGLALGMNHDANLPHPRSFGAFPRALRDLLDYGLGLGEVIEKLTSKPASRLGLEDRGVLVAGAFADVTVFNPEIIADLATYEAPVTPPRGIDFVFVNGVNVVEGGSLTHNFPGRLLRKKT